MIDIFCIEDFKVEFEKLKKKNSYRDLEQELIKYFLDETKTIEDFKSGTPLRQEDNAIYIKKRLKGSGGYRIYYLLIIKRDSVYLAFVHPKTGSKGASNIEEKYKLSLPGKIYECIKSNDLYKLSVNEKGNKIEFKKEE